MIFVARTCLILPATLTIALVGLSGAAHADTLYERLMPAPGLQANGYVDSVNISSQGRTVVFSTSATNWGDGEDFSGDRVIAVDLDTQVVEVISRDFESTIFRGEDPAVSGDGRYVAFLTLHHPAGPAWQVLRKDRVSGGLDLVSSDATGLAAQSGTDDNSISISADGRYIAFETGSVNFGLPSGSNREIFVKDMVTGDVNMASAMSNGAPSGGACDLAPSALSDDGRYLVFRCYQEIVTGAGLGQVYVRDLVNNTTEVVSRQSGAGGATSATIAGWLAISRNGRYVSFQNSRHGGLGFANGVDGTGNSGVYRRDRVTHVTTAIPRPGIMSPDEYDTCGVSAVADNGTVVMTCQLDTGLPAAVPQVFEYRPGDASPLLVSHTPGLQPGNAPSGNSLTINAAGNAMAFESDASDLFPGDTNGVADIFSRVQASLLEDVIFANGFQGPN